MSTIGVFIQVHGKPALHEAELAEAVTLAELHAALARLGIAVDAETLIFIGEADNPVEVPHHERIPGLGHGGRVHVSRCRRIATTVNFNERTEERAFPPGARVRAVKAWAVAAFHMAPKDAAEHVLQKCRSAERPASDMPLHQLVHGHDCALCCDLVPERRVEGAK